MTSIPNTEYQSGHQPPLHRPWHERINLRLIMFVLLVSAPFVWIIGSAVVHSLNHGITDHGDFKDVDLKSLGNFAFNPITDTEAQIPKDFRALDGQRVRLRGFVYNPQRTQDKDWRFEFVYDVNKCCFNGPPLVQERVFAYAKQNDPPEFAGLAEVYGILHVRLIRPTEGAPAVSVFDLDVESIKAVEG